MARIFRISIDLYPPSDFRPDYCIETWETVRTAKPNRVLHFSLKASPNSGDVSWVTEVIGAEIISLLGRTVGVAERLEF